MKLKIFIGVILSTILLIACNRNAKKFDASGTFETDEVIVSSASTGKILSFDVEEGDTISQNKVVGTVDSENLALQKEQVQASIQALREKTMNVSPQIKLLQDQQKVQESQLANLEHEKKRIENLLKEDAATAKQLDDINAQIDVVKKQIAVTQQQINVQRSNVSTQNRSIMSEG